MAEETAESGFDSQEVFQRFMNDCRLVADLLMLPDKKIRNVDVNGDGRIDGFQFGLGNPLNTAQPLSAIKGPTISVDGDKIDPEKVTLILRENRVGLKNASTVPELWWGYGELISVFVEKAGGLERGKHQLDCALCVTPAFYTFYPENSVFPTKASMTVE